MSWFLVAILSYFLTAWAVILDKFILSARRIDHPSIYAFYSGMLSFLTVFIFLPFGFGWMELPQIISSFLGGIIFLFGLLFMFYALKNGEASRVIPVVGATIPITSFFLGLIFLGENLGSGQILGIGFLIGGGLVISFDFFEKTEQKFFSEFKNSIIAGIFLAVSYCILKKLYVNDNFINIFVWSRIGVFIGALTLLIYPGFRKRIWESLGNVKNPGKKNFATGILFVFDKILGGAGSILLNYAISLGSVTIINALVAVEYAFVFIIGLILSIWLAKIFQENRNWRVIVQKIMAMIIIGAGVGMIMK